MNRKRLDCTQIVCKLILAEGMKLVKHFQFIFKILDSVLSIWLNYYYINIICITKYHPFSRVLLKTFINNEPKKKLWKKERVNMGRKTHRQKGVLSQVIAINVQMFVGPPLSNSFTLLAACLPGNMNTFWPLSILAVYCSCESLVFIHLPLGTLHISATILKKLNVKKRVGCWHKCQHWVDNWNRQEIATKLWGEVFDMATASLI